MVHWVMSMRNRACGWLGERFHRWFRECLIHACGRHGVAARTYCLMPDHIHLLSVGLFPQSDQILFLRPLRRTLGGWLQREGRWDFQKQPYDHVLRPEELRADRVRGLVRYITENPVRRDLVDRAERYPYSGCIVAGIPDLGLWGDDADLRFHRACAYLKKERMERHAP